MSKLCLAAVTAAVERLSDCVWMQACDAWCYQNLLGRDPAQLAYLEMAENKIEAQVAAGWTRFGQRDWQAYQRQGKIVTTTL